MSYGSDHFMWVSPGLWLYDYSDNRAKFLDPVNYTKRTNHIQPWQFKNIYPNCLHLGILTLPDSTTWRSGYPRTWTRSTGLCLSLTPSGTFLADSVYHAQFDRTNSTVTRSFIWRNPSPSTIYLGNLLSRIGCGLLILYRELAELAFTNFVGES